MRVHMKVRMHVQVTENVNVQLYRQAHVLSID